MNVKVFCVGLLILGTCLLASARVGHSRRVRLAYGDYDCSCSYYCPRYALRGGPCDDNDNWGWGRYTASYCCVPSYMDYDSPDMHDFGGYGRFHN